MGVWGGLWRRNMVIEFAISGKNHKMLKKIIIEFLLFQIIRLSLCITLCPYCVHLCDLCAD
jgi:hypothetical protein